MVSPSYFGVVGELCLERLESLVAEQRVDRGARPTDVGPGEVDLGRDDPRPVVRPPEVRGDAPVEATDERHRCRSPSRSGRPRAGSCDRAAGSARRHRRCPGRRSPPRPRTSTVRESSCAAVSSSTRTCRSGPGAQPHATFIDPAARHRLEPGGALIRWSCICECATRPFARARSDQRPSARRSGGRSVRTPRSPSGRSTRCP